MKVAYLHQFTAEANKTVTRQPAIPLIIRLITSLAAHPQGCSTLLLLLLFLVVLLVLLVVVVLCW